MQMQSSEEIEVSDFDLDRLEAVARQATKEASKRERAGAKAFGAFARREGLVSACKGQPEMLLWAVRQVLAQIEALAPQRKMLIRAGLEGEIAALLADAAPAAPRARGLLVAFGTEPAAATEAALDDLGFVRISAPEQAPHFVGRSDPRSLKLAVDGEACEISSYRPPARLPAGLPPARKNSDEREAFPASLGLTGVQAEPANVASVSPEAAKASAVAPEEKSMSEVEGERSDAGPMPPAVEGVVSDPQANSSRAAESPGREEHRDQAIASFLPRLPPARFLRPSPVIGGTDAPDATLPAWSEHGILAGAAAPSELMSADGTEGF
ncbi:hypothetical protein ILT44_04200 [Microvirga sp. BT689]|uniref:hypothetical protein n=1 Tax=Microvirga arvi TaxID=2778731 RepID=UPI0019522C2D|nr:hypothetical protein [Microvirga arvi]MBM6579377.1 hypothetical protein [Microvirga arvi]